MGGPALDGPHLGGPVVVLDLQVNPGVRVHPLEPDDLALQLDRGVAIELRTERVMRNQRRGDDEGGNGNAKGDDRRQRPRPG